MGQCSSVEVADRRSMLIDQQLRAENDKEDMNNLLLLGAGESGKSTFMKQMIHLFGTGHNPEDFRPIIYRNVVSNIAHLINKSEEWSLRDQSDMYMMSADLGLAAENMKNFEAQVKKLDLDELTKDVFTPNVAILVKQIWNDRGIQNVYNQRSRIQLLDSSAHFFEKADEIASDGYVPSTEDIILSRVRTTGYSETVFNIKKAKITITDVGGQRSERKKWLHFFDKCTSLVFFTALSEYDMTLYEEEERNRMTEALELFTEISNSRWFTKCPLILFLNKTDLFREKVKNVPIKDWFPAFGDQEQTYDSGSEFFKNLFLEKSKNRRVYVHFTCVIIGKSVEELFESLTDIIIQQSISSDFPE